MVGSGLVVFFLRGGGGGLVIDNNGGCISEVCGWLEGEEKNVGMAVLVDWWMRGKLV